MWIKEITPEDKTIKIVAKIDKVILSTGQNGQDYLIIHLLDKTGKIESRLWNATQFHKDTLKNGIYLEIDGAINVFRNQMQLKINTYNTLEEKDVLAKGFNLSDFEMIAPIDVDAEYDFIINQINKVSNLTYKQITLSLLKDNEEKFKTYPAAVTIHHNVINGLLWHSVSLLKNLIAIKPVYENYKNIDWDLAYCGAILHDIGKVVEMPSREAKEYSLSGYLLGHISIGNTLIMDKAKELKLYLKDDSAINEDVVKLQHVVLSSHGKYEHGSPVEPSMIEGILVSNFDNLDAKLNTINTELEKVEINSWTPKLFSVDNKAFYKHKK